MTERLRTKPLLLLLPLLLLCHCRLPHEEPRTTRRRRTLMLSLLPLLPLLLVTGMADGVSVVLSWAFVASRVAHSIVHLGANVVLTRFRLFVLGFSIVALMWAWFGLRLYVIG